MTLWNEPWVWAALAIGLVIIEVFAPGFLFLGFGIGAGVTALLLWVAPETVGGSLPLLLVIFATLSAVCWFVLRRALKVTKTQVKTFDRDINED